MKERILGIDTGTNSLGWAIVDYDDEKPFDKYTLVEQGVNIFQEGVKIEKGNESSRAAERTGYKHQRTGYWRRKTRKIALLKVLIENDMCPPLTVEELKAWRTKKIYPMNEEFLEWQRTNDEEDKNPYYYRNLCLTRKLHLCLQTDRYKIGRAIYHINQRRGFLSNRKEETKAADGAVMQSISEINSAMAESGFEYLGQYFYHLYKNGEKIRKKYTERIGHYEKELLAICRMQGLSEKLTNQLRDLIITQRPLKSQKHTVGRCVFEEKKFRCPSSHPLFEQFRLYSFLNSIRIQTPDDTEMRPLNDKEKDSIIPLFLLKSKKAFDFQDIAKKLSGTRNNFSYYKDRNVKAYRFNYHMDTSVSGCYVIAQLSAVFGIKDNVDKWLDIAAARYTNAKGKTKYEILNDIWHALYFFDSAERLKDWGIAKLGLDEKQAEAFAGIKLPSDYAQLSLKAIRKILPYMKYYGMIYSHAALLGNVSTLLGISNNDELLPSLDRPKAEDLIRIINQYDSSEDVRTTKDEYIKSHLANKYGLDEKDKKELGKLYHPSMIETFPKVRKTNDNGYKQLGSPRTSSVRNPMAMHSLFRLRHVINTLLNKGKIDEDTIVKIEFARDLNDSNMRAAIRRWQKEKEVRHNKAIAGIKEIKGKDYEPSASEILKYILWEDQENLCLYTGDKINITDLFDGQKYDIEHTIPRSVGGDSTEANLTLCQSKYNREVKRDKLPTELPGHEFILERIESWRKKYEDLDKQIRRINTRGATDPEMKARLIQKRHLLTLQRNYWRDKYSRFTMEEVPEGFSRRQGTDAAIISRYARLYLKSLFSKVKIVKGITTAEFRKIWGIQNEYEKKERVNHCHHAIDAVTIACIGANEYNELARYYHDDERYRWGLDSKQATFPKPWRSFTEDIMRLSDGIIVSHYTRDNMGKQTRKRIKESGGYSQGDTARGPLHLDTIYGAIKSDGEINYVVRRNLDSLEEKGIDTIVDPVVRGKVKEAVKECGSLAKALERGIWMNKEKNIPIKKVRCYARNVKRPIALRNHRDSSDKEYKRHQFVANDSNYAMAIYVGTDAKGKERREFSLINNLDAAKALKGNRSGATGLFPTKSPKGYDLKWIIRPGTMVILYENDKPEIGREDNAVIVKALYKITGLSSMTVNSGVYGCICMVHSQEARPSTKITLKNGVFQKGETYRPGIKMLHTQFKALIEGLDFTIAEDGEIRPVPKRAL